MARARATEPSDSENEVVSSPKTKSANGSKQAMAPAEQVEEVGEGSEEGSGEEEYEIESIIDSKRGGYGPVSCSLSMQRARTRQLLSLTADGHDAIPRILGICVPSQLERI